MWLIFTSITVLHTQQSKEANKIRVLTRELQKRLRKEGEWKLIERDREKERKRDKKEKGTSERDISRL